MEDDLTIMNSWPAFTDLMVSVVLILILVVGGMHALSLEDLNLPEIFEKQHSLEAALQGPASEVKEKVDGVEIWSRETPPHLMIRFRRDPENPMLQRISFSEAALFDPDRVALKERGKNVLRRVGAAIRAQSDGIEEIQIHGHADPDRSSAYHDNLLLASYRANAVYHFLQTDAGLDPVRQLMSATSFGEFSPIGRELIPDFGKADLARLNSSAEQKQLNRRTELLLFYRRVAGERPESGAQRLASGPSPLKSKKEAP